MNTGPKASRVHGVPWQIYDYKSYEESLELKLHLASEQKKPQQNQCSDAGNPEVTTEAQLLTYLITSLEKLSMHSHRGACGGW